MAIYQETKPAIAHISRRVSNSSISALFRWFITISFYSICLSSCSLFTFLWSFSLVLLLRIQNVINEFTYIYHHYRWSNALARREKEFLSLFRRRIMPHHRHRRRLKQFNFTLFVVAACFALDIMRLTFGEFVIIMVVRCVAFPSLNLQSTYT